MARLLNDESFERDALDYFPTPLADTLDEARGESSARAQRDKVVEVFRVAVRLLALMALSGSRVSDATSGQMVTLIKKLLRQGMTDGEWLGLARETVRQFASAPDKFCIPPLASAFFQPSGAPTSVFRQQGPSDKLLAMRKTDTVAHGVSGTEETATDVLSARLPDLGEFLRGLDWLQKVNLLVPLGRRVRPDGQLEYSVQKLVGVTPRRGFRSDPLVIPAEMALGHVHAMMAGRPPVDLHPLVQYAETLAGQREIYLFEEVEKHDVVLRTYPSGEKRSDPEALPWIRARFSPDTTVLAAAASPHVTWTLDQVRQAAVDFPALNRRLRICALNSTRGRLIAFG